MEGLVVDRNAVNEGIVKEHELDAGKCTVPGLLLHGCVVTIVVCILYRCVQSTVQRRVYVYMPICAKLHVSCTVLATMRTLVDAESRGRVRKVLWGHTHLAIHTSA